MFSACKSLNDNINFLPTTVQNVTDPKTTSFAVLQMFCAAVLFLLFIFLCNFLLLESLHNFICLLQKNFNTLRRGAYHTSVRSSLCFFFTFTNLGKRMHLVLFLMSPLKISQLKNRSWSLRYFLSIGHERLKWWSIGTVMAGRRVGGARARIKKEVEAVALAAWDQVNRTTGILQRLFQFSLSFLLLNHFAFRVTQATAVVFGKN